MMILDSIFGINEMTTFASTELNKTELLPIKTERWHKIKFANACYSASYIASYQSKKNKTDVKIIFHTFICTDLYVY